MSNGIHYREKDEYGVTPKNPQKYVRLSVNMNTEK